MRLAKAQEGSHFPNSKESQPDVTHEGSVQGAGAGGAGWGLEDTTVGGPAGNLAGSRSTLGGGAGGPPSGRQSNLRSRQAGARCSVKSTGGTQRLEGEGTGRGKKELRRFGSKQLLPKEAEAGGRGGHSPRVSQWAR